MKKNRFTLTALALFVLSLFLAYQQGYFFDSGLGMSDVSYASSTLPASGTTILSGLPAVLASIFMPVFNFLLFMLGNHFMVAIIVLALLVELITLYPAVNIQLMQKKIHLFHKKLVDRFRSGELSMGKAKRELDVLYSVNERMHMKGAVLVVFQLLVFASVLSGLYLISQGLINPVAVGISNVGLVNAPVTYILPILTGLSYLLHSLIKIQVKQREDYISDAQLAVALMFAILGSAVVFFFSTQFAVLLSVYVMTQITFATLRYIVVENKAKAWGKLAQKQLLHLLRTSTRHKNKVEHLSRKFNHLAFVRHVNFHLLEEGLSMSLAFVIAITSVGII